MRCPFTLTIWDKNLGRSGWIADPIFVTVTPRHNAVGTLTLVVPVSHPMVPALTPRGSRITCDYKGDQIFSGPRRPLNAQGPERSGTITLSYEDDIRLLWRLFGYPTPANPAEDQPQKEDKRTGPAETVVKAFISANKGRDPRPITVLPSHGWGSTIDVSLRMLPMADKLIEPVDQAGVGISVRQGPTGLIVDCYQPQTFGRSLSEKGGAVVSWSWSESPPAATHTIVGGPNEGTSREFKLVSDNTRAAEWGDRIEVLTDASSEELAAAIHAAGQKTLAGAGPTAGFKVELGETATFHYGGTGGVRVGDLVTAEVGGQVQTDVLREAVLSWDRSNGFTTTPVVGEHTDDPDKKLLAIVKNLARGLRGLQSK